MEALWRDFCQARSLMRDHADHARYFERKRDEACTPEDYVYFSEQCNKAIGDQSDALAVQNELHTKIMAAVRASGPEEFKGAKPVANVPEDASFH